MRRRPRSAAEFTRAPAPITSTRPALDRLTTLFERMLNRSRRFRRLDGRIILMASRALAHIARSPADYEEVYKRALSACDRPAILHWLGDMFDSALENYWGNAEFEPALEPALAIIEVNAAKVDGMKISLLDDAKEVRTRRRLPAGVKMYTGDDFNYPDLIKGDSRGHSHALLGIFDPIACAASAALVALARGDLAAYDRVLSGPRSESASTSATASCPNWPTAGRPSKTSLQSNTCIRSPADIEVDTRRTTVSEASVIGNKEKESEWEITGSREAARAVRVPAGRCQCGPAEKRNHGGTVEFKCFEIRACPHLSQASAN